MWRAAAAGFLTPALGPGAPPGAAVAGQAAAGPRLLVFAAASLATALDDVNAAWHRAGGTDVAASYVATSALARQVEAGAPADVVITADGDWMDYLVGRSLLRQGLSVHELDLRPGRAAFAVVKSVALEPSPARRNVRAQGRSRRYSNRDSSIQAR